MPVSILPVCLRVAVVNLFVPNNFVLAAKEKGFRRIVRSIAPESFAFKFRLSWSSAGLLALGSLQVLQPSRTEYLFIRAVVEHLPAAIGPRLQRRVRHGIAPCSVILSPYVAPIVQNINAAVKLICRVCHFNARLYTAFSVSVRQVLRSGRRRSIFA